LGVSTSVTGRSSAEGSRSVRRPRDSRRRGAQHRIAHDGHRELTRERCDRRGLGRVADKPILIAPTEKSATTASSCWRRSWGSAATTPRTFALSWTVCA